MMYNTHGEQQQMIKSKQRNLPYQILYFSMTALLFIGLLYNQILPDWISLTIELALLMLLGLSFLLNFKKGILIALSVLLFISSGALIYSQYTLERLLNQEEVETNIIGFVVLKDSGITNVEEMQNAIIAATAQTEEPITNYLKDYLNEEIENYTWKVSDDDLSNLNLLYAKKIDVMILDKSMLPYIIEEDPDFESKTTTILTLEKDTIKLIDSMKINTAKNPFIVLISGVDSRTPGALSEKARSDVNILVIVNPKTHNVLTISIPRDTYTPLGCRTFKMDKLTHAGVYGVDCTVKTIENLFGLKVNYYVKINFTSFMKIIDAVGKIEVYSKYAFTTSKYVSYAKSYSYTEGMNIMNAEQALFFSRERHNIPGADEQRGLNQQEVIKGLIKKLTDASTLLKVESIINAASNSIDTNLTTANVLSLVSAQIENNQAWNISTSALTGTPDYQPTYSMGSKRLLYVSWPKQDVLADLKGRIDYIMNYQMTQ